MKTPKVDQDQSCKVLEGSSDQKQCSNGLTIADTTILDVSMNKKRRGAYIIKATSYKH
jgi:hypothetical protein